MDQAGSPAFCTLLIFTLLGSVQAQRDCSNCYQMSVGAIVGMVIGDLLLTLLIALAVYCLAGQIHRQMKSGKGDMKKSHAPETESPYQELEPGYNLDVYRDLKLAGANRQ